MLTPLSEETAKIYSLIPFKSTDRLAISLADKDNTKFSVNIYGATITQEEYRSNWKRDYSTWTTREADGTTKNHYFTKPSQYATHEFPLRIPEKKRIQEDYNENFRGERWEFAATDITTCIIYKLWIEPYEQQNNVPICTCGHEEQFHCNYTFDSLYNGVADSEKCNIPGCKCKHFNKQIIEKKVNFTEDAAKLFQYLLITSARMSENAKIIANYKAAKEELDKYKQENNGHADLNIIKELESKLVPAELVENLQWCADKPLLSYQQLALYLQYHSEGFANFSEQGTGKTPINIATIDNLAIDKHDREEGLLRVLVICPNNARSNWESEFHNFSTVDGRVTIIRGGKMERIKCMIEAFANIENEKYSAVICGYDTVPIVSYLTDSGTKWDIVITDEGQYFKDPNTKRWKDGIEKLRNNSVRRYNATGTPVCNSIADLWTQLEFIRKGGSGFLSFDNFKNFYTVKDNYTGAVTGYQNLPFIQERLAQCSYKITKKEALPDLPDKVFSIIEVEMGPHQTLVYEKIAQELQYKVDQQIDAAIAEKGFVDAMTVKNILTQMLRLAQITSGFITYDEVRDDDGTIIKPRKVERFSEQPKLAALLELLQSRGSDEKTLIWACWESDLLAIQEFIESHGYKSVLFYGGTSDSQRIEAEYLLNHDDSYTVFIGNPAAGGTALNLLGHPPHNPEQSNFDVTQAVYYSQNWSFKDREQSGARPHRKGTRRPVTEYDLQIPNTIDTKIRNRVLEKKEDATTIQDLREILSGVLKNNKVTV